MQKLSRNFGALNKSGYIQTKKRVCHKSHPIRPERAEAPSPGQRPGLLQGVLLIVIIPRALPWARSFWAFSPTLLPLSGLMTHLLLGLYHHLLGNFLIACGMNALPVALPKLGATESVAAERVFLRAPLGS